jgi:uncharacterized protein (TIGR02271 family)
MASMVDNQTYRENEPRVLADDERLTIAVHDETLEPRLREVETGRVRVHKRVEEVPDELLVDAGRDEVTIERVPIGQTIESAPEPRQEGDTLVIPVVEEVIVTETRLVLREEVRITRRRVTEQIPVQATLRKERVEIEQLDENAFDQSASR